MARDGTKRSYGWTVLSVTTVGALTASMQSSALLIALPDMMAALHMEFLTMMWVLLSYMLITTTMLPVLGYLSDMLGRKRLYVIGFGIFGIGSLLCGLAQPQLNGVDMIAYRIIQAFGGALLIANSAAMVTDAFDHRSLGLALGINGVAAASGIIVGPIVGGILTPIGWEWVFWANVPIAFAGMAWGWMRLREPKLAPRIARFDWSGSAVFVAGLSALLLGVSLYAFPLVGAEVVYILIAIGGIGIAAFLLMSLRAQAPMIDLRLFRNRDYAVGNLTNLLNGLCRGASLFLLIFFLQGPFGQDPLTAGLSLIPFGISFMIFGPLAGHWSDQIGPRLLTILGLVLSALGLLGLAFIDHNTPFWVLAVLMLINGIGGGLFNSPNSSTIMKSVPPERRGMAASTRVMLANVGSMFSLAIALPMVLSNIPEEDMMRLFLYGGGISSNAMAIFEHGLHAAFLLFFVVAVAAVIVGLFRSRGGSEAGGAGRT